MLSCKFGNKFTLITGEAARVSTNDMGVAFHIQNKIPLHRKVSGANHAKDDVVIYVSVFT